MLFYFIFHNEPVCSATRGSFRSGNHCTIGKSGSQGRDVFFPVASCSCYRQRIACFSFSEQAFSSWYRGKIILACAALRTGPFFGEVFKISTRRNAIIRISNRRIVYPAAQIAYPLFHFKTPCFLWQEIVRHTTA
jgi:hypothetical protein